MSPTAPLLRRLCLVRPYLEDRNASHFSTWLANAERPGLGDRVLLRRSNLTRLADRMDYAKLLRRETCPGGKHGACA